MPTTGHPVRSMVAVASITIILILVHAAAAVAAVCPSSLALEMSATASTNSHYIKAIIRNHNRTAVVAEVGLKIALPTGLCPIRTSTRPILKPRQRPVLEGTATGTVNVYWSGMTFKPMQARKFRVKSLIAGNLTKHTTLFVDGLAWVGSDGQCLVPAGPVGVSSTPTV